MFFSRSASLLGVALVIASALARPQNGQGAGPASGGFGNFFQHGNNPQMQQYAGVFKEVPAAVKVQMTLAFLNGFDKTCDQIKAEVQQILANYPEAQNAINEIFTNSKQQKEQALQAFIDQLPEDKKAAGQAFMNDVVKNSALTMKEQCNGFVNYVKTLDSASQAVLFKDLHGGAGGPGPQGAGGMFNARAGNNDQSGSSANMCDMAQQMAQKMAQKLEQFSSGQQQPQNGAVAAPVVA